MPFNACNFSGAGSSCIVVFPALVAIFRQSRSKTSQFLPTHARFIGFQREFRHQTLGSGRLSMMITIRESGESILPILNHAFFALFSKTRKVELRRFGSGLFNYRISYSVLYLLQHTVDGKAAHSGLCSFAALCAPHFHPLCAVEKFHEKNRSNASTPMGGSEGNSWFFQLADSSP